MGIVFVWLLLPRDVQDSPVSVTRKRKDENETVQRKMEKRKKRRALDQPRVHSFIRCHCCCCCSRCRCCPKTTTNCCCCYLSYNTKPGLVTWQWSNQSYIVLCPWLNSIASSVLRPSLLHIYIFKFHPSNYNINMLAAELLRLAEQEHR